MIDTPQRPFIQVDRKGRLNLGLLASGVSGFELTRKPCGTLILMPLAEIPRALLSEVRS